MKMSIPTGYPGASNEAVELLFQRGRPSPDDLRVMSMIESAGEGFYRSLADLVSNPEARELLMSNARDERRHAERLVKAFALLCGEALTLPASDDENPYAASLQAPDSATFNDQFLSYLASAEEQGHDGYERWAQAEPNAEIAQLYRLNAREERMHGKRDLRVRELLGT